MAASRNALLVSMSAAALAACVFAASPARAAFLDITLQQTERSIKNGTAGTIDLTKGGVALDWIKTTQADISFAEKDVTSLLSIVTAPTAGAALGNYADDSFTYTWSGGDAPNASGSSFAGGNRTGAAGTGFQVTFTAPAAGAYQLKWYSAANNVPNWRLTGSIGAATDFQQAGPNLPSDGVDDLFWTADFTADSAGQVLTLDLLNTSATSSVVAVTGVTVAAVPEPASAAMVLGAAALIGRRRRRAPVAAR